MSCIVFTEGEKDLLFLREVHRMSSIEGRHDTFNNKTDPTSQNIRITQFRRGNMRNYLYKSEGGRSKLNTMFSQHSLRCFDSGIKPHIMVDLDGDSIQNYYDSLNKPFNELSGNTTKVVEESHEWYGELCRSKSILEHNGKRDREFDILMFEEDMEDAVGIFNDESEATMVQKIRKYLGSNDEIKKIVIDVLKI